MKKVYLSFGCWCSLLLLSSCYTSTVNIGDMQPTDPVVCVNTTHDAHFLRGLIGNKQREAKDYVGDNESYRVKQYTSFLDGVLEGFTLGIYSPTTTKYYLPYGTDYSVYKKPKAPVRDHGLQIGLEGGFLKVLDNRGIGETGCLIVSYKMNPRISAGLGLGIDAHKVRIHDVSTHPETSKIFLRAQYRMTDKTLAPIASCDIGCRYYKGRIKQYWGGWRELSPLAPYAAPSIGLSWRALSNAYFDIKAGYALIPAYKGKHSDSSSYYESKYSYSSSYEIPASSAFVTLGWTYTL